MQHINKAFLTQLFIRYKRYYIGALLLSVLVIVASMLQPKVMMNIIDNGIEAKNLEVLLLALAGYFVVYMVTIFLKPLVQYIYFTLGRQILYRMRTMVIEHLFTLSGHFYSNIDSGNMLHLAQYDIATTENLFTAMIPSLLTQSVIAIGYIIILSTVKWELLLIVLALEAGNFLFQKRLAVRLEKMNQNFIDINRASYSNMNEMFNNIKNIVILHASRIFLKTYHTKQQQGIAELNRMHRWRLTGNTVTWCMNVIGNICIFGLGGWFVLNNQLTIGGLMIFISYSGSLLAPLELFYQSYIEYRQALVSIRRINTYLQEEGVPEISATPGVANASPCKPAHAGHDTATPTTVTGVAMAKSSATIESICLDNVSFRYEPDVPVLHQVSMQFDSCTRTAIIGKSGSGKSTILNLIIRLWDPTEGIIRINNRDIRQLPLDTLRDTIAYIPQDTFLFNDTIYNNITLGKSVDREKVTSYIRIVEADFVFDLPDRLETIVGEQGAKLSGGQKQKIALARALLLQKQVLILDEFTAAIDTEAADRILRKVEALSKNSIVILISHHMNQIVNCHRVYHVEEGRVYCDS